MVDNELSIADVMALQSNNSEDGFGGQNFLWFILLIFFFGIGGNGFGFGGGSNSTVANYVTQSELQRGFDQNNVVSKLDNLGQGICSLGYENSQLSNQTNINMLQGFNANNIATMQGFNDIGSAINTLGYQMQQCCCATQQAIREEGNATRSLIAENTIQGLRDSLSQAQGIISNTTQSQYILGQLGRFVTNPACPNVYCGTAL
jgi:hypothetical protein